MNASRESPERASVLDALLRYWTHGREAVGALPIPTASFSTEEPLPPQLEMVALPEWASDLAADGGLLIPAFAMAPGEGEAWRRVDYLAAAFWYLNGLAERGFERRHRPIHGYAFHLKGWDSRVWQRAWVNRIALLLRRWAARERETSEDALCGPLPPWKIHLTHDVDAITKTLPIRIKQTLFHGFNMARGVVRARPSLVGRKAREAVRSMFGPADYWCFETILGMEEQHGLRSIFHFYGGPTGLLRLPHLWLIDIDYRTGEEPLRSLLRRMVAEGWTVGLHPSYNSFQDATMLRRERETVEQAAGAPVVVSRQHWLRFSWLTSWKAQAAAGLELDSTIGFNHRSAFRNGAALDFHPWDFEARRPLGIRSLPLVLMDSHLYDYSGHLTAEEREEHMRYWLDEIKATRGEGAVVWHQRVMSDDYGWGESYAQLLTLLAAM